MEFLLPLAFFGPIGTTELIVILLILVLLFGASKLPQLGGAIGKTIRSFKSEMREGQAGEPDKDAKPVPCAQCGAEILEPGTAFCPKCGAKL